MADVEVAIIGAGPYGLSAAAHLKAMGADVRVFGKPMEFWADRMPAGMLLRSPRVASNISDSRRLCSLDNFERSAGIKPIAPLPLETFVEYGRWFQHQLIPDLDQRNIVSLERANSHFKIVLSDQTALESRRVIVAAGIGPFKRIPAEFSRLPEAQLSHCYDGRELRCFADKRVAVIGAGQSALESAALLHEAGADVEVFARIDALRWIGQHPWLHNLGPISSLLYSYHDIGPVGISRLVAAPNLVRRLPLKIRDKIRVRAVRPAGSKWLPSRLVKVKITTACSVKDTRSSSDYVELKLSDGTQRHVDHVLLGTGYSVDIRRYRFLAPSLLEQILLFDGYPRLSSGFSCSVPGLHFLGAPAARTFGPLLNFVTGTDFASHELTSYLKRRGRQT